MTEVQSPSRAEITQLLPQNHKTQNKQRARSNKNLTSTQEPRFHNETQFGRGALALVQLFCMVPTHATLGGTTAHQNNLALSVSCFSDHFLKNICGIKMLEFLFGAENIIMQSDTKQINWILIPRRKKSIPEAIGDTCFENP